MIPFLWSLVGLASAGGLVPGPETLAFPQTPIGKVVPLEASFTNTGDTAISFDGITFTNLEGNAFGFNGTPPSPGTVEPGDSVLIRLEYTPTSEGMHHATVELNTADCAVPLHVVGSAYLPCLEASAAVLDFGPVAEFESNVLELELRSCDGRTVEIDRLFTVNSRFTFSGTLPLQVTSAPMTLFVEFSATDLDPQEGVLELGSFGFTVDALANDCPNGDPALYDTDEDGTSDCGTTPQGIWEDSDGDGFTEAEADCNDSDPNAYPGATEVDGGIDDNCNGLIDEHKDVDRDGAPASADCDDNDALVRPDLFDFPDGVDNDCDGQVDEELIDVCSDVGPGEEGDSKGCGCDASGTSPALGSVGLALLLGLRRRR